MGQQGIEHPRALKAQQQEKQPLHRQQHKAERRGHPPVPPGADAAGKGDRQRRAVKQHQPKVDQLKGGRHASSSLREKR